MEERDLGLSSDIRAISSSILEWKNQYGNIYYEKIGSHEYIFRLLTKKEYLSLYFIQFHISEKAEDILLEKCVLYPMNRPENYFDNLLAGEVATLVEKILSLSGFASFENIKSDLDKEREKINLLDNQIVLMICKAFPHITPSDIDNFDYQTILHHITLAEALLDTKLEITKQEDKHKIDFDTENKGVLSDPGTPSMPSRKRPRR